jgi:hypothetical protein
MEIIAVILFLLLLAVIINLFRERKKQDRLSNLDNEFTRNQYSHKTFEDRLPDSGNLTEDVEASQDSQGEVEEDPRSLEKLNATEDTNSPIMVSTILEQRGEETNYLEKREPKEKDVFVSLELAPMVSSAESGKEKVIQDEPIGRTKPDILYDATQNDKENIGNTAVQNDPTEITESENLGNIDEVDREDIVDLEIGESLTKTEKPDIPIRIDLGEESKPSKYKPPVLTALTKVGKRPSARYQPANGPQNEYRFPVAVRIYFQRGGSVNLSLYWVAVQKYLIRYRQYGLIKNSIFFP